MWLLQLILNSIWYLPPCPWPVAYPYLILYPASLALRLLARSDFILYSIPCGPVLAEIIILAKILWLLAIGLGVGNIWYEKTKLEYKTSCKSMEVVQSCAPSSCRFWVLIGMRYISRPLCTWIMRGCILSVTLYLGFVWKLHCWFVCCHIEHCVAMESLIN